MSGKQVIERVFQAPIELIWELWTSPKGRSSWWGPRGFEVEVSELDLRVGGHFTYTMRAIDPQKVAMMKKMGRPASFQVTSVITAAQPYRFAYDSPMGPETLSVSVSFTEVEDGVKMVLVIDATKPEMTGGATMGWHSSLEKFQERLGAC
jgi:uncharacterized protein YndB with AHSA1/START domain